MLAAFYVLRSKQVLVAPEDENYKWRTPTDIAQRLKIPSESYLVHYGNTLLRILRGS